MSDDRKMRLGLTYWPARKGPFFWDAFDQGEVASELAHVADLGCDFVRLLLPWETVQPQETVIRSPALDRFGAVLDAAEQAGIDVVPVLFVGHLFNHRFLPRWLMLYQGRESSPMRTISDSWEHPGVAKNFYEDRELLEVQQQLVHELVGFYSEHPAVHAWDPGGNGLTVAAPPRDPDAALHRLELLVQAIREADEGRHPIWWTHPDALLLTPAAPALADVVDLDLVIGLDTYPLAHQATAERAGDADFLAYLWLLARSLAGTPVACSATGLPTAPDGGAAQTLEVPRGSDQPPLRIPLYDEPTQAEYFEQALGNAQTLELPFFCSATFADVPESLWEQPPFDQAIRARYMGLVGHDGREKEVVRIVRGRPATPSRTELEPRALEIDPEEFAADPGRCLRNWYRRFREGEI